MVSPPVMIELKAQELNDYQDYQTATDKSLLTSVSTQEILQNHN